MNKQKSILVSGIIGLAFLIAFGFFLSDVEEKIIQPDDGFRVAFIADQDIPTLTATFTVVSFNYKKNTTIPVPDKIREKCREL